MSFDKPITIDANNETNNLEVKPNPCFTHQFIYKTKQFNIDPVLISRFSNYFEKNLKKFMVCNTIYFEGNEEEPDVSDFIQTFFDICHSNYVQLTDDNVIPLCYLSYIYDVQSIKRETAQYIDENYDRLSTRILQFNTSKEHFLFKKETIANKLIYHIDHNSEELKFFSINEIFEIIEFYYHKNFKENEEDQIINFMFDCLKHYGRDASVLFTFIHFNKDKIKYIEKLVDEFQTIFDFTYINETLCKLTFEQSKEINKLKQENNKETEINLQIEEEEEEFDDDDDENENLKKIKKLKEMNDACNREIRRLQLENDRLRIALDKKMNEEMIEKNNQDKKSLFYQDENLVFYELFEDSKTSDIIESSIVNEQVIIPSTISFGSDEYKIVKICDEAFSNSMIQSLSFLSDSYLEWIGNSVFIRSNLRKLSLPSSLRKLDKYWCFGCDQLSEIEVDPSNPYFTVENGLLIYQKGKDREICFASRNIRDEFVIPEGITKVCSYSFDNLNHLSVLKSISTDIVFEDAACQNCRNLIKIVFCNSNSLKIGFMCFTGTNINSIILKGGKIEVDRCCFKKCRSIQSLAIQSSMSVTLGSCAFDNCTNMRQISIDADSSLTICDRCFRANINLNSLIINCREVIVGKESFYNCLSITSFTLPQSKKIIFDDNSFEGCKYLKTVSMAQQTRFQFMSNFLYKRNKNEAKSSLPDKIISIGNNCFKDCISLSEIKIENAAELAFMRQVFVNCIKYKKINFRAKMLTFGDDCFIDSKPNTIVLEGETINVGNRCFYDCQSITSFLIPSALDVEIGECAFDLCKNIKKVTIESVSSLKLHDQCFYENKNLNEIRLFGNKLVIGKQSFFNCVSITSLSISNSNQIIFDDSAFEGCKSIESVSLSARSGNRTTNSDLAEKIISIGNNCFKDCKSLIDFEIEHASKLTLQKGVFINCLQLETLNFNSDVIDLKDECFIESKLNTISLEGEVVNIGNNCFKDSKSITSFCIPSAIDVDIGGSAFEGCKSIEEISIESISTLKLNDRCFCEARNLGSIKMKGNEVTIGKQCFSNCTSITSFIIRDSLQCIFGENAFENCIGLETFTILARRDFKFGKDCFYKGNKFTTSNLPDKIIVIGNSCFMNCTSLSEIKIENATELSLEKHVFINCNLLETIDFTSKTLNIGDECFIDSNVSSIILDGENVRVGNDCFNNCQSIKSFCIPSAQNVEIGESAFESCKNIETLEICAESKLKIFDRCFRNAEKLNSVTINSNEVILGKQSFYECFSITSFSLPYSSKIIFDDNAFEGCKNLEIVELKPQESETQNNEISSESNLQDKIIFIGTKCFMDCISLAEIKIDNATEITFKKEVFVNCNMLDKVNFTSKSLNIGDECFIDSKVSTVLFEGEVIKIGNNCFNNCQTITSFCIPSSIDVKIGESAFESCKNIKQVSIESTSSLKLSDRCFYNSKNLNKVNLFSSKLIIEKHCFSNCVSIFSFTIQDSSECIINDNAFEECTGLEKLSISARKEFQAGNNCFNKASKLKSVCIDSKNVKINTYCFANCSSLSSFTITEAENTMLCQNAFNLCKNLETVDVSSLSSFKALGFCFSKVYKIKYVKLISKVVLIGNHCFDSCSSNLQINCPITNIIDFFENSFNGISHTKCLKCQPNVEIHPIQSNSNVNGNECLIF